MALPLPKVLYDVGPGGGIVTSMGGGNALANNMHLRKINQIKAQYAPLTTQAEAMSKLAYANLMAPQFLAKAMANPAFVANLNEDQKNMMKDLVYKAGTGQGTGNYLNQMPKAEQKSSSNSFLDWAKDLFKGHMDQGLPKRNALMNNLQPENAETQLPQAGASGVQDVPMNDNDPKMFELVNRYRQSPEGQAKIAETGNPEYYPEGQELRDWAMKNQGTKPIQMTLTEGQRPIPKTWAERTAEQQGIVKEGEKAGEIRAKDREELDNQYQQAVQSEVPLKHLNKIVSNPVFQNMRKFPWFQKLQLDAKSKIGSPEEQKLVGDFQATALRAVAETVMGFRGRILDKEVTLANDMKVSPNDTMGVILGKLPSIEAFNEMTKQRSRIASKLMRDQHMGKGDALEIADGQVNGEAIRKRVEKELEGYPNREDIEFTAKEMNITPEEVIKRLKAKGKYHA